MWKMSAPDSPTQHLFIRIPQTELYTDPLLGPSVLEVMPDVSSSLGGRGRARSRIELLPMMNPSSKSYRPNRFPLRSSRPACSLRPCPSTHPTTSIGCTRRLRPRAGGTSARRCSTSSRSSTARSSPDSQHLPTRSWYVRALARGRWAAWKMAGCIPFVGRPS